MIVNSRGVFCLAESEISATRLCYPVPLRSICDKIKGSKQAMGCA